MKPCISALALSAALLASYHPARADVIDTFTLTSPTMGTAFFSLPATLPAGTPGLVENFSPDQFSLRASVTTNGVTALEPINFYGIGTRGGLAVPFFSGTGPLLFHYGPCLPVTPPGAPGPNLCDIDFIAAPATFTLFDVNPGNPTHALHLAIAQQVASPVPEPPSIALFGTGLLVAAAAARHSLKRKGRA